MYISTTVSNASDKVKLTIICPEAPHQHPIQGDRQAFAEHHVRILFTEGHLYGIENHIDRNREIPITDVPCVQHPSGVFTRNSFVIYASPKLPVLATHNRTTTPPECRVYERSDAATKPPERRETVSRRPSTKKADRASHRTSTLPKRFGPCNEPPRSYAGWFHGENSNPRPILRSASSHILSQCHPQPHTRLSSKKKGGSVCASDASRREQLYKSLLILSIGGR